MTDTPKTHEEQVAKVAELARDCRVAMLTTVAPDGSFTARPMGPQKIEFDGDLWFFTERDTRKLAHIAAEPHVGVTLTSNDTWVSIDGTAEMIDDRARNRELWDAAVAAWLPQGPEDPSVVLIKVTAHSAEYLDSPVGRLASAISFVKAKVTGEPLHAVEGGSVDLDR